jgi:glutamine synthetase
MPYVYEFETANRLSALAGKILEKTKELASVTDEVKRVADVREQSLAVRDKMLPVMADLRAFADEAESITSESAWPYPTYDKLLFSV